MSRRDIVVEPISARITRKRPANLRPFGDLWIGHPRNEIGMLGDRRDDGHKMRLARTVIADDKNALVVGWLAELQLGKHELAEQISHSVGDDECFDQTTGICGGVGFPELNDVSIGSN